MSKIVKIIRTQAEGRILCYQSSRKSTCAKCKFCCSFRRCSLWETPLFPENTVEKLESQGSYQFDMNDDNGKYGRMHLQDSYNTDDENEEVPCFFLDPDKGCTLSYEDKPFDCKIWPLRIMKKDDEYVIALTPTCPSIGKEPSDELQKLVDDGLGDVIYDYAKTHPFIIKDYKEGFPVLMVRK